MISFFIKNELILLTAKYLNCKVLFFFFLNFNCLTELNKSLLGNNNYIYNSKKIAPNKYMQFWRSHSKWSINFLWKTLCTHETSLFMSTKTQNDWNVWINKFIYGTLTFTEKIWTTIKTCYMHKYNFNSFQSLTAKTIHVFKDHIDFQSKLITELNKFGVFASWSLPYAKWMVLICTVSAH